MTDSDPAQAVTSAPATREEELRLVLAEHLARNLGRSESLIARAEKLIARRGTDRIGALNAAARLLTADAKSAAALAQVVSVEQRRRTIVERIQRPDPQLLELNSRKMDPAAARAKVQARIVEIATKVIAQRDAAAAETAQDDLPAPEEVRRAVQEEMRRDAGGDS